MFHCNHVIDGVVCGQEIPDNPFQQKLFEMTGMCEDCRTAEQRKDEVAPLVEALGQISKAIKDVNETLKLLKMRKT